MDRYTIYLYSKPTRFGSSQGLLLATQLIGAVPDDAPALVRAGVERLVERRDALAAMARDRLVVTEQTLRDCLSRLGNAWAATRDVLVAHARLEPADGSGEASKLARVLFARGVSFVRSSQAEAWAYSTHLLELIDEQSLEPRIAAAVGPQFLARVRELHAELGEMLGVGTSPADIADTKSIAAAIDALSLAIADYGRLLAGSLDWDDPAQLAAFRRAMAPLDAHRRTLGGGRVNEPIQPVEPASPAPNGPDAPLPA